MKGYDENGNIIYDLINGNGKVKKYNIYNALIFKGEYLNGKRNGNGKEYELIAGNISFEGVYLNGQRKGKKYFNGKLIFEGEYLNDKRNGKGKEYNYESELEFEGEYLNGEKFIKIIFN